MNTKTIVVTGVRNRRGELLRAYALDLASRLKFKMTETLDDGVAAERLLADGGLAFRVADQALSGIPTIVPQEESLLCRTDSRDILVPIGGDEAGPYAVDQTMPVAASLGARVMIFHSTWRKPHLGSEDPLDHCRERTRRNLARSKELAGTAGIPYAMLSGFHGDIVEGIILTALRARCCLIAMARSLNIGRGSHVDRLVIESPIPVLVWR